MPALCNCAAVSGPRTATTARGFCAGSASSAMQPEPHTTECLSAQLRMDPIPRRLGAFKGSGPKRSTLRPRSLETRRPLTTSPTLGSPMNCFKRSGRFTSGLFGALQLAMSAPRVLSPAALVYAEAMGETPHQRAEAELTAYGLTFPETT